MENLKADDTIIINGLQWDRNNYIPSGQFVGRDDVYQNPTDKQWHMHWNVAKEAAISVGKRLPSKSEWRALVNLGYTWDSVLKGMWLGSDSSLKTNSTKSIFVNAFGYKYAGIGEYMGVGEQGWYWSLEEDSYNSRQAHCLLFISTAIFPESFNSKEGGMSVRLVKDI